VVLPPNLLLMVSSATDTSRRLPTALVVLVALVLGLVSALVQIQIRGAYPLREVDSMQRAGSARVLVETGQWATRVLRSWELVGHEHTAEGRPWPVQNWSLGYPLVLAGAFAVWRDCDAAILACSVAAYLGCVLLTFLLARRLWDERVAVWATALFLAYGALPLWSALGHVDAAYTLCLLTMTVLLLPKGKAGAGRYLAAGVMLGLAYSVRPTALAWVPLLLVAGVGQLPRARRGARGTALVGLVAVMVLSAGLTHLLSAERLPATGPTISYMQMSLRETTDLEATTVRTVTPEALSWGELLGAWPELAKKMVRGAVEALGDLDILLPPALLILAPLGLLLSLPDLRRRVVGGVVLAAIGLTALGVTLTVYFGLSRYAATWAPFLAVYAGAGLVWMWDRARQSRVRTAPTLVALLAIVVAGGGYVAVALPLTSISHPPEGYLLATRVAQLFPPDAIVASPKGYELSWHGRLRAIQTEAISPGQMLELDQRLIRLEGFVLEKGAFGGHPPERVGEFRRLAEVAAPYEVRKGEEKVREWEVYGR